VIALELKIPKGGLKEVTDMAKYVRAGITVGMEKAMLFAEGEAKKSFNTSGHLQTKTGHLQRSIKHSVKSSGNIIIGSIGSNVVYARIHEKGGVITPKVSMFLKFVGDDGKDVYTKQSVIPARPYLYPAVNDNLVKISAIIEKSIVDEVNRG